MSRTRALSALVPGAATWGVFWGAWGALLPAVKASVGASNAELGLALLAIPVGAVPGLLVTGRLIDRFGERALATILVAFGVAVAMLGLVGSLPLLAGVLLLIGATSGAVEVALAAVGSLHEVATGQRLLTLVQAATPIATVLAAPAAGLALALGASVAGILTVVAVLVLISSAAAPIARVPRRPAVKASVGTRVRGPGLWRDRSLWVLGGIAATVLFVENAVEQWGALHLTEAFSAGPFLASLAPAIYMACLAGGRVLAHAIGHRVSDRFLVLLAAPGVLVGLGVAALAPTPWLALVGFGVAGLGNAAAVPTIQGLAGRLADPGQRGAAVSVVTTLSYGGFLASPALVGALAGTVGLTQALGLIALLGLPVFALVLRSQALRAAAQDSPPL